MCAEPSPEPLATVRESLRWPRAARCCWTKLARCPWLLQPKLLRLLQEREFYRLGDMQPVRSRCAGDRQHQSLAAVSGGRRTLPRGPVLPAECDSLVPAAASRTRRRRHRTGGIFRRKVRRTGCPAAAERSLSRPRCAAYHWPGNVRELANTMRRAVAFADGNEIGKQHACLSAPGCRRWTRRAGCGPACPCGSWRRLCWKSRLKPPPAIAPMRPSCWASACAPCATKFANMACRHGGCHELAEYPTDVDC